MAVINKQLTLHGKKHSIAEALCSINVGVGGGIGVSNKVHAKAVFTLSALWRLTGFAWQVLQTDGSEHLPSILARNFLAASF